MKETHKISSDYSVLFKLFPFFALIVCGLIIWGTISDGSYLITYIFIFAFILSVIQLIFSHIFQIKRVSLNYSEEEFRINSFNDDDSNDEKIPFKDFVGYKLKFSRVVRLEFTSNRKRYFLRPIKIEFISKAFIKDRLNEILSNNMSKNKAHL